MIVNIPLILECLEEWSSKEEQERLWLSDGSSGFVGSAVEAYEGLFGDSNLKDAIDGGAVQLPSQVLDGLAQLEAALDLLDLYSRPKGLIDHPGMIAVRQIAGELLNAFRSIGTDGRPA
ncbi:hypothetical protein [Devosia sp.]|uniref:hypothetical protein n=1 Tax=Devosia sp. TaxID=1871048 RepID=UPI002FC9E082